MKTLILFLLTLLPAFSNNVVNNVKTIAVPDTLELNKQNLWEFINKLPFQHKDIVYKKAILETGHLKSKIAIENNNLYGMKQPKKRKHLCEGVRYNYAVYNDWRDSVVDYLLWQQYCFPKNVSKEQYYDKIQRIYSTTPTYVNTLKQIADAP